MEDQFKVDRSSCPTTQESFERSLTPEPDGPGAPSQLVIEIQRLLGTDSEPDSLFFVESWSIGGPAAVRNFQRRRQEQAHWERDANALNYNCDPRTLWFMELREMNARLHFSAPAETIEEWPDTFSAQHSPELTAACQHDPAPQECGTFADEWDSTQNTARPMTQSGARKLLGVNATSTLGEIKAAYRHLASQWHPDRLERTTEDMRRVATEKMVAINAAYRLLRSSLRQKST
jgi:DnaJ-domain-containing protein 1